MCHRPPAPPVAPTRARNNERATHALITPPQVSKPVLLPGPKHPRRTPRRLRPRPNLRHLHKLFPPACPFRPCLPKRRHIPIEQPLRKLLPLSPRLLRRLINDHDVNCWLVNTGWTGGAYGEGRRMPIKATRKLLTAALDGSLESAEYRTDPNFGFAVPTSVADVETSILDPRSTWSDKAAYDEAATRLVGMFIANFEKFEEHVDGSVLSAAPAIRAAAE